MRTRRRWRPSPTRSIVVTYEFENVPAPTAAFLAAHVPLHPGARALAVTQDRLSEKTFVSGLGLAVAPFRSIDSLADLEAAVAALGRPSILKTRRFGYDGKGQVKITAETDLAEAYDMIGRFPAVLEGFVPFIREVSVVAARGTEGEFAAFDVCENEHRDHILAVTRIPAQLRPDTNSLAIQAARSIGEALGYVGVFAVEMFVTGTGEDERVIVNEIAPRVHNSGHWTSEGADTSQFDQHVRAVCGFPLGSSRRRGDVVMENLIGEASLRLARHPGRARRPSPPLWQARSPAPAARWAMSRGSRRRPEPSGAPAPPEPRPAMHRLAMHRLAYFAAFCWFSGVDSQDDFC